MLLKTKTKRLPALLLAVLMLLACIPMGVLAEETEEITVEVIPEAEIAEEASEEPAIMETEPVIEEEIVSPEETSEPVTEEIVLIEEEAPAQEEVPAETPVQEETEVIPVEEIPEKAPEEPADEPTDNRKPLQAAIEDHGHVYVATVGKTEVFGKASLKKDSLVYTTTSDIYLVLATAYTDQDTVKVWFLDEDFEVVTGYVDADDLDEKYLLDEDIVNINYLPVGSGITDIGKVDLFAVNGRYPAAPVEEHAVTEEPEVTETPSETTGLEETTSEETAVPEETDPAEAPAEIEEPSAIEEPIETEEPAATDEPVETETPPEEPVEEPVENPTDEPVKEDPAEALPTEEPVMEPEEPAHADPGTCVSVTTKTRVFAEIDAAANETTYSGQYLGHFVKDAIVQILSVGVDEAGNFWYQVRFLYGDNFADGKLKWTDYATCWVLASETGETVEDSCTVTDFAYTMEYLKMTRSSGRRLMKATPMNGFTLKNINGRVGGFYAWQQGLYGSSGKDSDYPQLAKSAAHGTIYATPHYLEGFQVFCLEHNLNGPGEGSGSNQTAKGPYVLVDMDTFVTNPEYGGTTGVRYKAKTMHALGWVLRHTYPFMALNRSDSNNEVWSRVAGQFAMREVIKQLEGAQYVRPYWDMDNFYSFSGGAPAVYLEYARWLAANGIARASITGKITASNQSLSVSGSNYIGTVKLTTDADLIRIPKTVGTLTGNSGGSDSTYYYVKSGDTIQVTSTKSKFAVSMESLSSSDEEANFLVGVASVSIQKILVPIYGAPNILKSGSVTFELSFGEISVTKKSSDGILLKGTVFELLNSSGSVIATATTNASGVASFASLAPGTYTVREKTPSQGYKLAATSSQNISVVAGVTSKAEFTNNRIQGKVRIVKTDSVTNKPLAGAVFTVTRLSGPESDNASDIGKVVATITTNAQGIAETGLLPWGEYRITETGVPADYLDAGYTTTVWIK